MVVDRRRGAVPGRALMARTAIALFGAPARRRNPILGEASEGAVAPEARL